ncbi:MAG: hypothetical protein ABI700_10080 [Chloroflexota bacterium]
MTDENLAKMRDTELLKLFAITSTNTLTRRAKQIIAELERRGYLYDPERNDMVTCAEWNIRHRLTAPIDCEEQARRLNRS